MGKPTTDTPEGRVQYSEKWDGSRSARVQLEAIDLFGQVAQNRVHRELLVHAIAELEAAVKELRLATASGDDGWVGYAKARQRAANHRIVELQHG